MDLTKIDKMEKMNFTESYFKFRKLQELAALAKILNPEVISLGTSLSWQSEREWALLVEVYVNNGNSEEFDRYSWFACQDGVRKNGLEKFINTLKI